MNTTLKTESNARLFLPRDKAPPALTHYFRHSVTQLAEPQCSSPSLQLDDNCGTATSLTTHGPRWLPNAGRYQLRSNTETSACIRSARMTRRLRALRSCRVEQRPHVYGCRVRSLGISTDGLGLCWLKVRMSIRDMWPRTWWYVFTVRLCWGILVLLICCIQRQSTSQSGFLPAN